MNKLFAAAAALSTLAALAQPISPPPTAARAFVLYDTLSGQLLAAAAENERFEPASLTKLMTAYLVFTALKEKRLAPDQVPPVSERAWKAEGSRMFIEPRKPAAVENLVRGMIVQSGNDASIALAEAVAGNEESFVQLMNRQAQKLGLRNTRFANATGLPAPEHYSTAYDLALLSAALIRDFPEYYPLYSQKEFSWNGITQSNRNRLLWSDATVDGVKTGFTEAAGYCLIASARRGSRRLISVVLGTQSDALRMSESQKLLNFGFHVYDTQLLYKKGEVIASPEIFKGTQKQLKLGFPADVWLSLPRDRFAGLKATLETQQPFLAPYAAGQKAGIMKLTRDGAAVAELPVMALEDVPVAGFLSRGWDTLRLMLR
jgi:D-alanyl-D-alanine carboxypeptidase (penicillin-binding protein 5/6)